MERVNTPDEQRLARLLALLPGWADEKFWRQVDEVTGSAARVTMNALLTGSTNPAPDGTYVTSLHSAAEEVLERYARPAFREQLARVIGEELACGSADRAAWGRRWLDDAAEAAWHVYVSGRYSGDPVRVLKHKWELP